MNAAEIVRRVTAESRTPQELRDAVYLFGDGIAAKQSRFWLLLAIPIQGIAVAIAYGEAGPLLRSAGILLAAALLVMGLAAVLAVVLPELKALDDNGQVAGSVSPTIVDLVAAAVAGLAGAFAVGRRDIG